MVVNLKQTTIELLFLPRSIGRNSGVELMIGFRVLIKENLV